ncbi:NAD(P)H-binding protein [Flavobacterium muglaense]|uniref:NAD(P)H-binding protein n=1 Tax=Flavobacterium muglaense TaxID=2764716 RepID=A0A923N2S7_9FLAO|nr:NAD(P)H-binding protein [Flavobacterium muglaense]MBC5839115.1 NAD(P)H-binding protein [Flavobacterium muglaense]MBC5845584.1 NAD(P)H-binding protein [Flavobacterium muglaense]
MKTALIIGSTGLIGSELLQLLLKNDNYSKVIAFSKREIDVQHPKLEVQIINFDKPESYESLVKGDDFFCTIGTTIKKAGSKEAFKKVDYNYPKQFATAALQNGVNQFLLISSMGADQDSTNFYLKTKGEIEQFLKESAFKSVTILRPSLLLGNRNEFRFAEKTGGFLMKAFSFLLIGKLKNYKPIESKTVAKALELIAQKDETGFHIYQSASIEKMVH